MESYKSLNPAEVKARELQKAVAALDEAKVKKLLADGALPSLLVNNTTCLHIAVRLPKNSADQTKALAILDMLLDKDDHINELVANRTVMGQAGHNNNWSAVLLIASRCTADAKDTAQFGSALLDAVRFCEDEDLLLKLVEVLLERGAKANLHNKHDGFTVLHWAVLRGKPFVLRMLLDKFPESYLQESTATELHGKARTPARMAYKLFLEYDQKTMLSPAEQIAKRRLWECICAVADVAYMPIITGKVEKYSELLLKEKYIILAFVRTLPLKERWEAVLRGQDDWHPLGRLNHTKRNKLGISTPDTVDFYHDEEVKMRTQGFPQLLEAAKKPLSRSSSPQPPLSQNDVLRVSPQMFQSAARPIPQPPQFISDYIGGDASQPLSMAYSPLFRFSPPPVSAPLSESPMAPLSVSQSSIRRSPAIPIKRQSPVYSSKLYPEVERRSHSRSVSPSPSPSPSPGEVLDQYFGKEAESHSSTADNSGMKSPSRF